MKTILSVFAGLLVLQGCAPETADRYNTAENESEAVALLNEHQYEKAVWLIENRNGTVPQNQKLRFILAQAYLGQSGIEPLAFAARVSGEQPTGSAEVQALFPKCSNEKLASFSGVDPKCLVKRIFVQAPDADKREFARARDLFLRAYPDPAAAPPWANTLIGVAETISVIQRAGKIYLYAKKYKESGNRFDPMGLLWLQKQIRLAEAEAREAVKRAQYSGDKISRLVSGISGDQLFERLKGELRFKAQTGIQSFSRIIEQKNPGFSEEVDLDAYLEKMNKFLDE
ncbi:MAG: hypothetical protein AB7K68_10235 [Bacteriovoracia bacterium]